MPNLTNAIRSSSNACRQFQLEFNQICQTVSGKLRIGAGTRNYILQPLFVESIYPFSRAATLALVCVGLGFGAGRAVASDTPVSWTASGLGLATLSHDVIMDTCARDRIRQQFRYIRDHDSTAELPESDADNIALVAVTALIRKPAHPGDRVDAVVVPCCTDVNLDGAKLHRTPLLNDYLMLAYAQGNLQIKERSTAGDTHWIPGGATVTGDPEKIAKHDGVFRVALMNYKLLDEGGNLQWLEAGIANIMKFDILEMKQFKLINRDRTSQHFSKAFADQFADSADIFITGGFSRDDSGLTIETRIILNHVFFGVVGDSITFTISGDEADIFSVIEATGTELKSRLARLTIKSAK